ncbi:hypothetical protein [Kovacikia minuta]|nr:hypothetical protein [Kovacikia minuta]
MPPESPPRKSAAVPMRRSVRLVRNLMGTVLSSLLCQDAGG